MNPTTSKGHVHEKVSQNEQRELSIKPALAGVLKASAVIRHGDVIGSAEHGTQVRVDEHERERVG